MSEYLREQLSYRHMLALTAVFVGWASDERLTPGQTAKICGWSESLRALTDKVGPDWPPKT